MAPQVDLAVVFRAGSSSLSKAAIREEAAQAEEQYQRLVQTLHEAGMQAVGRRGESASQLLVLIWCPPEVVTSLVQRERYSDFLNGLSTSNLASVAESPELAPADRLRLIYGHITSTPQDGGLGINSGLPQWNRVQSVMALHDHDFNQEWIRSWTTHRVDAKQLDKIRDQFGESVALYFSFVAAYGKALAVPAAAGIGFYFLGTPYSAAYSTLLSLWSVGFVEWWRVRERVLSVRWSTRGSFRVERRRAEYRPETAGRLARDLRAAVSVPVVLLCAGLLASVLTGLFIFEAFVTTLYTGPGHAYIGLAPTILFMAIIPRFMALFQAAALRLTVWENHAHQSRHEGSLTLKTFSLSAVTAYLGLALSAFVYVPFGGDVMASVQTFLFRETGHPVTTGVHSGAQAYAAAAKAAQGTVGYNVSSDGKGVGADPLDRTLFEADAVNARAKLNPARLQDQMFAFTVTNQVVGLFLEIGLPFVLRAIGKGTKGAAKKKRVAFEDKNSEDGQERALLERVRAEVALPDYTLFADYSEMVTQFGYVALWSTIWPLAPAMALLNNLLELRSDAYKITVHGRRPVPSRTDTVGPWLDALQFLTWAGALTNAALVYLFHPRSAAEPRSTVLAHEHPLTADVLGGSGPNTPRELLLSAAGVALLASHGYLFARALIRHAVERVFWKGNARVQAADEADKKVKEDYMRSLGVKPDAGPVGVSGQSLVGAEQAFWGRDEGLEEIRKSLKDA